MLFISIDTLLRKRFCLNQHFYCLVPTQISLATCSPKIRRGSCSETSQIQTFISTIIRTFSVAAQRKSFGKRCKAMATTPLEECLRSKKQFRESLIPLSGAMFRVDKHQEIHGLNWKDKRNRTTSFSRRNRRKC